VASAERRLHGSILMGLMPYGITYGKQIVMFDYPYAIPWSVLDERTVLNVIFSGEDELWT
jgi:hypothetical protein